jgi:hypothetical protein
MNQAWIGEGYAPAYQISATPFVTSSLISTSEVYQITFPQVTRFITIQNRNSAAGNNLFVGFTQNGLTNSTLKNYLIIGPGASYSEELRIDRLFLSNSCGTSIDYTVLAGLTSIRSKDFTVITSSNGFSGVG